MKGSARKSYYPLFADVTGRRCLVVGGGLVAQRKVAGLLRCGAEVVVISPMVTRRLAAQIRTKRVRHITRTFRPSDARSAWLVYAATDDPKVNVSVFRAASRHRVFANVVDQKRLCSFIAPAVMRRGELTIGVSTGGGSPSLAKRLRRDLHEQMGAYYVPMLELLARLRRRVRRTLSGYASRKRYFEAVLSGRPAELMRQGHRRAAQREALVLLARAQRVQAPPSRISTTS